MGFPISLISSVNGIGIILDQTLAPGQAFWTLYLLPGTGGEAFPASSAFGVRRRARDCSKAQKHLMEATTGWSLKGQNNTRFWYRWRSLMKNAKCKSSEHRYRGVKVRGGRCLRSCCGAGAGQRCSAPSPAAPERAACTSACSCPQLCLPSLRWLWFPRGREHRDSFPVDVQRRALPGCCSPADSPWPGPHSARAAPPGMCRKTSANKHIVSFYQDKQEIT